MTTTHTTTESITRAAWSAAACDCDPDDSRFGVYPDPSGSAVRYGYAGEEIRGWPVKKMDGTEPVTVTDDGRVLTFSAESWVLDRIGSGMSGRDAAKVRNAVGQ